MSIWRAFSFAFITFVLSFPAQGQTLVEIMGRSFSVGGQRLDPHDSAFLAGIGLESLDIKGMTASDTALRAMADHVLSNPDGSPSLESAFFARKDIQNIIFYSYTLSPSFDVEKNKVEGLSILYDEKNKPFHAFFENTGTVFEKVPEYQVELQGPLTYDEIRLLHFSYSKSSENLPLNSELYSISRVTPLPSFEAIDPPDFSMARKLVTDNARNAGRFLSRYYMGYDLRIEGAGDNYPCGASPRCSDLSMPYCWWDGDVCAWLPETDDNEVMITLEHAARESNMAGDLPMLREKLYYFRDNVLSSSVLGKQYIRDYYKLGSLVRTDISMLLKYVPVLPKVYSAINRFASGSGDEVIMDDNFADLVLDLIQSHREVTDPEFQALLDRAVVDIARFRGLTKDEVLSLLASSNTDYSGISPQP